MTIPHWKDTLLYDADGNLKQFEYNGYVILRSDPVINGPIRMARDKDIDKITLDAMVYLQSEYNLRIGFMMVKVMVKVISETETKIRQGNIRSSYGSMSNG